MKRIGLAVVTMMLVGCGGELPADQEESEQSLSVSTAAASTVPGVVRWEDWKGSLWGGVKGFTATLVFPSPSGVGRFRAVGVDLTRLRVVFQIDGSLLTQYGAMALKDLAERGLAMNPNISDYDLHIMGQVHRPFPNPMPAGGEPLLLIARQMILDYVGLADIPGLPSLPSTFR